jgi:hypothetical protein
VDQELHHELRPCGVEHYRREARSLLRAARVGDGLARLRAHDALGERARERFVLADALHVVAVEHGYQSWPAFKRSIETQAESDARVVGRSARRRRPRTPVGLNVSLTPSAAAIPMRSHACGRGYPD